MKMKRHISAIAVAALILEVGAAYAAEYPVFLTELKFGETVTDGGGQSFGAEQVYGWSGLGNTEVAAEEENGNYFLSAKNDDGAAGISADFGKNIFLKAAPKGTIYWDFEDEVSFQDDALGYNDVNASGEVIGERTDRIGYGEDVAGPEDDETEVLGKWTTLNYEPDEDNVRLRPAYIPMEDVETYNALTRAVSGIGIGSAQEYKPEEGVKPQPAKGSNQVCVVRGGVTSSANRPRLLGMRVKLSKNMIEADKTYKLSYHMMNNNSTGGTAETRYLMFAAFRPFDAEDNVTLTKSGGNDEEWVDFTKYITASDGSDGSRRYWQQCETTLNLSEADFDEEGYTTLWLFVCGRYYDNGTATPDTINPIYAGSYLYIDNIALTPVEEKVKENNFNFNCLVKGSEGDKVEVKLAVDGKRELMKKTVTLADDGWNEVSESFVMSSDDEYISGEKHGNSKLSNNGRVKLTVSSTAESLKVDDVIFMREIDEVSEKYSETDIIASGKLYNSDADLENAKFEVKIDADGIENTLINKTLTLQNGVNAFYASLPMPGKEYFVDGSRFEYKITNESGGKISENLGFDKFYANGVDVLPANSDELGGVMKQFGTGAYVVEFSLEGVSENETVRVSCCDETVTLTPKSDGAYQVELNIESISDTAQLNISTQTAEVSDISMRKAADY